VAAFNEENGVVSVGGVGFDVNCGVRTLNTGLMLSDVKPKIREIINVLFDVVPAGLGERGEIRLPKLDEVLINGARWVVEHGYGTEQDLEYTEEHGKVEGADPSKVSEKAVRREKKQLGTLGSGNHYLEIQYVDEIFDEEAAKAFGLEKNSVVVTIHCGSRALGHQIGTDYLKTLAEASRKYNIPIRERELVCAPINSKEGQDYIAAVNCAINYAFANRQVIAHLVRKGFKKVFPDADVKMLYDIGHNTCKVEYHEVNTKRKKLYVHRKGATRSFGPGRKEVPKDYRDVGQPVIVGGTMGTYSFILAGTSDSMEKAWRSACHGAGRTMSRTKAKKKWWGSTLQKELLSKGIYIKAHSMAGLAEEAPGAYKNVLEVVNATHNAGLAKKVVKVKPLGVIKG
jgi:tRNA-splicing ligase RtcB